MLTFYVETKITRSLFLVKLFLPAIIAMLFSCNNLKEETIKTEEAIEHTIVETIEAVENEPGKMKLEKVFYPNGELKMEGNSTDGIKEGKWTSWYETGIIWSETYFENGRKNGSTTTWYPNGKKRYEGFFKDGKESGKWTYWDEAGNLIKEVEY